MKHFVLKTEAAFHKLETALVLVSGSLVMIMMFLISADVMIRYFINSTIPGTYELVQFLFIGVVYLGVSYVQAVKGNIKIEIAGDRLSDTFKYVLDIIGYLVAIFIVAVIVRQSSLDAWQSYITHDFTMGIIQFPLWPAKACVFIGLLLLEIRLILDLFIKFIAPERSEPSAIIH